MSYILDALKKSEQERGRGTAPGVQTMHSTSLNYHANKTPLWPYFLLAAILINLAALMYFIIAKSDPATSAHNQQSIIETRPATSSTADAVNDNRVALTAQNNSVEETIIYKTVSIPVANRTIDAGPGKTSAETTRYQQPRGLVLERDELPSAAQQYIPVMEFSAHVYSTNPLQRSIVINGRFMEEGDRLGADLILDEITPDGAIFDYQGQLFRQSVVSAWN
jgi:general secretion pathway protein B